MSLSLFILLMTVTAEWDGSGSHLFWGNSILFFYSFLWKISCILISKIVEKDDDGKDDNVATLSASVCDGRIKCRWQVQYTTDDDADSQKELAEKGYTLPEYAFVVECGGATSGESGVLEVRGWIKTQFKDEKTGKPIS